VRYVDSGDADHSIALIAQYAWRAKGLDVVMIASSFDVVTLDVLLPVIDELALSVSVVKGLTHPPATPPVGPGSSTRINPNDDVPR
jgi:hypothetical protein